MDMHHTYEMMYETCIVVMLGCQPSTLEIILLSRSTVRPLEPAATVVGEEEDEEENTNAESISLCFAISAVSLARSSFVWSALAFIILIWELRALSSSPVRLVSEWIDESRTLFVGAPIDCIDSPSSL